MHLGLIYWFELFSMQHKLEYSHRGCIDSLAVLNYTCIDHTGRYSEDSSRGAM